ncbi:MAG: transporter substrate-binding domain-containing protein [Paludibacterium sp.]|uniref:substrate-binding periplasmic protein n=1 Tax=Paludibacterium sp. TaxID=1917523 RepID=UPI0025EA21FA|nr:transporter substrate-binding domain-containing protein [Paludibacterium sp.]MBV8049363.1 transporter substrate-binding domain-containing protein [Paludibacterium sp.]MBV8646700.1 transporter substrate-binding domain-containing protein [Paludibacterium sp.]
MNKLHISCGTGLVLLPLAAPAAGVLLSGVADSDGPPVAVIEHNTLQSGLSKDIGQALAQAVGRRAVFAIISRKRVEWALENGSVDIVCNANPAWYDDAGQLGWTHEIFPLVERVAVPANKPPVRSIDDLVGKRISVIRGYSYPSLDPLWATGKSFRDTEDRLALLIRAITTQVADAAIVTEWEYVAWAKVHPDQARQVRLSNYQFASTPTMCAVSPKARVSVDELNRAIDRLRQQGKFKAILRDYQWQAE